MCHYSCRILLGQHLNHETLGPCTPAWRQHSKTVRRSRRKENRPKLKEGLLVGAVQGWEARQHLQAAASPLPGEPYGATGNTRHCIRNSHEQSTGKEHRRCPGNKAPRQKVAREKGHGASKNNTRAGVWCSKKEWCDKAHLRWSCPTLALYYKNPRWKCLDAHSCCPQWFW